MNNSDIPGDIGGDHPLGPWLNKLKRAVMRRTLLSAVGNDIKESTAGFTLTAKTKKGGGGGALNYRGNFVLGTSYEEGDIVRVTSGPTRGLFCCVLANNSVVPVYPEPATPAWHLWTFSPQLRYDCQSGITTQIYLMASD
jgi:hypothetical protein